MIMRPMGDQVLLKAKEKQERTVVNTSNGQKKNDLNGWQVLKVPD